MTLLIISEKPSAGRKIAAALSGGKARTAGKGKVTYLEFHKDGKEVVVAASVGHVYGIKQKTPGSGYPVFDIHWTPLWEVDEGASYTKDYLSVLRNLCREADEVVNACDFDAEGSLIGKKIIEFNAPNAKHSRMKFSTLTAEKLQDAFANRGPLDLPQALAGEARHELDWLWGINVSRALMAAIKKAGIFRVLSVGRVQGPALALLAEREKEITAFVSKPYWQLFAHLQGTLFEHVNGKFWEETRADESLARSSESGTVKAVESKKVRQRPPAPFDLTTLQMEAYRCFSFPPTLTLSLAQNLYEESLISYPRTSSQKLPAKLGLEKIIHALSKQPVHQESADFLIAQKRFVPVEGEKEDPAHPAIHPTGEMPSRLNAQQAKLYDLIAKRFLALFAPDAKKIRMNVVLTLGSEDYSAQGVHTVEAGWQDFYAPYSKTEEVALPELVQGQAVRVDKLEKVQKDTQPPKRYTPASIIKALETKELGTKATRANIVQTLFDRHYLEGKSIQVTPLGMTVERALEKNVPEILKSDLTRRFEGEMEEIEKQKTTKEKVVHEGVDELRKLLDQFRSKEGDIGKELVSALRATQRQLSVLGPCIHCGKDLVIRKSQYGFFVGCSGYPACRTLYPLPKEAQVKPLGKACDTCKTPQVSVFRKGKRTFQMCLDPKCPTKASWGKPKESFPSATP